MKTRNETSSIYTNTSIIQQALCFTGVHHVLVSPVNSFRCVCASCSAFCKCCASCVVKLVIFLCLLVLSLFACLCFLNWQRIELFLLLLIVAALLCGKFRQKLHLYLRNSTNMHAVMFIQKYILYLLKKKCQ